MDRGTRAGEPVARLDGPVRTVAAPAARAARAARAAAAAPASPRLTVQHSTIAVQ